MKAQVVYERDDMFDMQSGPYGYRRVGLRLEDRVIWLGLYCDANTYQDFLKWENIAKEIVAALEKNGEHPQ